MSTLAAAKPKLAYTLAEAAEATGLSDDTLYRKHHAGEITLRKSGPAPSSTPTSFAR